ncbi:sigma 54-interacting transcriptional regulator [Polyangium sp. y55x31]|uniref:sigma 54-interacting transcriptional regulator n=1 Tax=Polyangium sp. y55x31 TaxID=3042688 RepID=UPI00248296A5|nr:sigma 54-interacting transcriptional regulator [Polyangium sp. y55x31]MDI1481323.1 sigma 54-interacting transcriptional regulator [Polyangium sp. y55x31]
MNDATVLSRNKVEVRGGRIKAGKAGWVEVGTEPVIVGRNAQCSIVLDDAKISAVHAELVATEQGVRVRDLGSRNGTFAGGVRVGEVFLLAACKLRLGETELSFEPARPERITVPSIPAFGPLVAQSAGMRGIFEKLSKVAPTDLTVLITGETGTGKEVVAQAIHQASARAKKPFVVVDCGSIPSSLAEATLFGHERGAFTGAVDKRLSPFVEAEGGTIFLDELGELPIEVQPKLLRALAERRIKSVGGSSYREVDVRVLAATRRDLVRAVNTGAFRSDLYFRVAQVRVELPALRQRLEDIPVLVRRMLRDLGGDEGAFDRVSNSTLERLMRHDWPGNVRELKNAVAVAYALGGEGEELDVAAHLGALTEIHEPHVAGPPPSSSAGGPVSTGAGASFKGKAFQEAKHDVLARFEREYFAALFDEAKGNISEIARRAGMERAHVRTYLKRHGIHGKTDPGEG